jgi:hypothetical protein
MLKGLNAEHSTLLTSNVCISIWVKNYWTLISLHVKQETIYKLTTHLRWDISWNDAHNHPSDPLQVQILSLKPTVIILCQLIEFQYNDNDFIQKCTQCVLYEWCTQCILYKWYTVCHVWVMYTVCIDWLIIYGSTYFTYMETSPLPVKGCKI